MVPGGAGGGIGEAMQNLGAGVVMVDGVKDLAKFGLRSGGAALGGSGGSSDSAGFGSNAPGGPTTGGAGRRSSLVDCSASSSTTLTSGWDHSPGLT